jgi:pimeloyl-ACP methyl ester carboxylesterase
MPPTGVDDLAAGIPKAVAGQPQVRIEKYGTTEHPSWAVYVGGTADWNAVATDEPWDLTANVTAVAGQNAGSFRAVMQSMRAAGIGPDEPVVITGHSQGGLVATQVAAAGVFSVRAVATFGAPESRVPVPTGVATLTVEHTDDVVTALGGESLLSSDDRVTVRREAFATVPVPEGAVLPAHNLDVYRETARRIDASPETTLQDFRATVTAVLGSAPGEAVLWRGVRSSP